MSAEITAGRPRRRAKARGPSTPDAVEIAMEAVADDASPTSPAQQVLRRQAQLLEAQLQLVGLDTWERRLSVLLRVLLGLTGLAILALAAAMVIGAARSKAVIVESFDTPPSLAERGLSPRVLAGFVQDGLADIQAENIETATRAKISNAWTDDISVEVPQTGVSIGEIDRLLRKVLGHDTHVSGALVRNPDDTVSLTIRATGVAPQTFTGKEADVPQLAAKAAEHVYGLFEPRLFANYLVRRRRIPEALAFSEDALSRAPESSRSALALSWASALRLNHAPAPEVVAKERLATELDPQNWTAWSNLIGDLYDTDGEEGAIRAGARVEALTARLGSRHQVDARNDALVNYWPLVQNWSGQLEGFQRRVAAAQGRTVFVSGDNAMSFADAYGRMHDWSAAERALAAGDRSRPSLRATRDWIDGMRRLEGGDLTGAAASLSRFDEVWKTDSDTHYTYPYEACMAGLALGLTGHPAQAEAIFREVGRWSLCQAARAEILEAAGQRPPANAAFAQAIAIAPSAPYAYHRKGLALLRRGDADGALRAFRAAQERGPAWADPLKGEGDALAAQGRWREAVGAYRKAERFAPNWAALHLAWAEALLAQGKRGDARRQADAAQGMAPSAGEFARIQRLRDRLAA